MGSQKQTIGFHYLFDILFGLGRGPINNLRTIKVGDKIAWEGPLCDGDCTPITSPELFGGEKKEGGIQGPFRLFFGADDQVLPGECSVDCGDGPYGGSQTLPDVKASIGGNVSEFRGVTMLWFSGLVSSMNPYPKAWAFRVRRHTAGWYGDDCWYPEKCPIYLNDGQIQAMNAAHIIYQCLTDPIWGRGLPASYIGNSFVYAANTFCTEGMGLCFAWNREEEVDQFIQRVLDIVDAVLYVDQETGKLEIKLIRSDYDPDDLPLFTRTTGLLDITDEDDTSQDEIINEVIGTGRDPITNEDFQERVFNLAARQSQGSPNPETKDYTGIPTRDLMLRVLQGDLKKHAAGLKGKTVVLDRAGWKIRPGMPFRVADPRKGIANMILRPVEITDQNFRDGRITLRCMQDVFGLPSTSYVTPVDSTWTPPPTDAVAAHAETLVEANYRDLFRQADSYVLDGLTDTDALAGTLAATPHAALYQYDLAMRAEGEAAFDKDTVGAFTGTAILSADITAIQTTFVVADGSVVGFPGDLVGSVVLMQGDGHEQMEVTAYDSGTRTFTVKRGVGDTIPQPHSEGSRLWTIDDDLVSDERVYASGETVEAKVLTRTPSDVLDETDAALLSLDVVARQARPYPPGDVRADGDTIYALINGEYPEPVITWTHRDRLLQADQIVDHSEASVGPEAGVTYTIRVYDGADGTTLLRTVAAIAGATWTYDAAMQVADGNPISVYIELEAVRDGLASYQHYRFQVPLQLGYGVGYGLDYGGAGL
jgi:hypothetical protein